MMYWVVEKLNDERRGAHMKTIQTQCQKDDVGFMEIQIVPFERSVVGGYPNIEGNVVVYGSTAIFTVQQKCNWTPGVFSIIKESETLDMLGDRYLNHDMRVLEPNQVVPYVEDQGYEFFFVKPDKDLKSFDGTVTDALKFPYFIENAMQYNNYDPETKICVSSIKHIDKEWRIFVFNQEIVGVSQYRKNRRLDIREGIDDDALKFASEIIKKHNPALGYVIDVCKTYDGELKVIEYNTFNCSGFYDCDVSNIVKSVNLYFRS